MELIENREKLKNDLKSLSNDFEMTVAKLEEPNPNLSKIDLRIERMQEVINFFENNKYNQLFTKILCRNSEEYQKSLVNFKRGLEYLENMKINPEIYIGNHTETIDKTMIEISKNFDVFSMAGAIYFSGIKNKEEYNDLGLYDIAQEFLKFRNALVSKGLIGKNYDVEKEA